MLQLISIVISYLTNLNEQICQFLYFPIKNISLLLGYTHYFILLILCKSNVTVIFNQILRINIGETQNKKLSIYLQNPAVRNAEKEKTDFISSSTATSPDRKLNNLLILRRPLKISLQEKLVLQRPLLEQVKPTRKSITKRKLKTRK